MSRKLGARSQEVSLELTPAPLSWVNRVGYASQYEISQEGPMQRFDGAWMAMAATLVERQSPMGLAHFCKPSTPKGCRGLFVWSTLLTSLFLAVITIPIGFADTTTERMVLPIEVLSADGATVSRTITLRSGDAESVRSLWLQTHGVRYANQASVQVNASAWIPLNNDTATIAEP